MGKIEIQKKLNNLKDQLTSWNRATFGNVTQREEDSFKKFRKWTRKKLSRSFRATQDGEIEEEFQEVALRKEIKWRQKSRINMTARWR